MLLVGARPFGHELGVGLGPALARADSLILLDGVLDGDTQLEDVLLSVAKLRLPEMQAEAVPGTTDACDVTRAGGNTDDGPGPTRVRRNDRRLDIYRLVTDNSIESTLFDAAVASCNGLVFAAHCRASISKEGRE